MALKGFGNSVIAILKSWSEIRRKRHSNNKGEIVEVSLEQQVPLKIRIQSHKRAVERRNNSVFQYIQGALQSFFEGRHNDGQEYLSMAQRLQPPPKRRHKGETPYAAGRNKHSGPAKAVSSRNESAQADGALRSIRRD
jgi:hypothetical protein